LIDKSIVSNRLHVMKKIQKEGKWILHELFEMTIQNRLIVLAFSSENFSQKEAIFVSNYDDEKSRDEKSRDEKSLSRENFFM